MEEKWEWGEGMEVLERRDEIEEEEEKRGTC